MLDCLRQPQTIIVAVVDATSPMATQTTLPLAHAVDPDGHRTVGVLTKCDLVPPGDEKRVLRILHDQEHRLPQGWFAVKNWSSEERQGLCLQESRDASEIALFSQPPWQAQSPLTGLRRCVEFSRTSSTVHCRRRSPRTSRKEKTATLKWVLSRSGRRC